ncbi:MAG: large conductance mechanosensitive channel protein MscL [Synechococcales bacterium]|nr:large conductance mechanosensitive channel protein MscL [Synechococcales bacterium]
MARSSFWDDFKAFLMQGNVVDLAVAVIIGGAFGKIVTAVVEKLFMPIIGLITPGGDWKKWMIPLGGEMLVQDPSKPAGTMMSVPRGLYFGEILGEIITFVAIAFVVFMIVRALEKMKKRFQRQAALAEAEAAAAPDPAVVLQERMIESLDRVARSLESR